MFSSFKFKFIPLSGAFGQGLGWGRTQHYGAHRVGLDAAPASQVRVCLCEPLDYYLALALVVASSQIMMMMIVI